MHVFVDMAGNVRSCLVHPDFVVSCVNLLYRVHVRFSLFDVPVLHFTCVSLAVAITPARQRAESEVCHSSLMTLHNNINEHVCD